MSDEDEVLRAAEEVISDAEGVITVEETTRDLLQKAVPLITLFNYLRENGVGRKAAERMIEQVWRSWFEWQEGIIAYGSTGFGHSYWAGPEGED